MKVLLIMNEKKQLPEGYFTDGELHTSVGRKLITTPLDSNDNIIKKAKLACVMKMVLKLDEFNNTGEEFMSFEQIVLWYKGLNNEEFVSLSLGIMDQNSNSITDVLGMTIVLHIR